MRFPPMIPLLAPGLASALLSLASSCNAPGAEHEVQIEALPPFADGNGSAGVEPTAPRDPDERAAISLIESGDYEGARRVLDGLLLERNLDAARTQLAQNQPEDGLLSLDRVLEIDPRHAEARLLKADGSLMLGEKGLAAGKGALFIEGAFSDALEFYRRAGDTPRALFGASRAAYYLNQPDEALRLAQSGMRALESNADPADLGFVPERVLSEAAFSAYVRARTDEREEAASSLFPEAEDALSRLLGRSADDRWVWGTLSDLYEWENMNDDARGVLERGLVRLPGEVALLDRLERVARSAGGPEAVIDALAAQTASHSELPISYSREGLARFDYALDMLNAEEEERELLPDQFAAAEKSFAHCREIDPQFTDYCKGYEVMCRNGIAWCHFQAGELDQAAASFKSLDEILERGMEWSIDGRLLSGVMGLGFVGGGYNDESDWVAAAETFEYLSAYQPEESLWANNAGFFLRDAAVELEFEGRRLCRAAHGELTEEAALAELRELAGIDPQLVGTAREAELFAKAANETMQRARELVARSGKAYLDAARLAPDDVRVVNDTALVHVYYLHARLEESEGLLLSCVEMGREQLGTMKEQHDAGLADASLEEEARAKLVEDYNDAKWELENAWGDAFQNLGVLHANFRDDKVAAENWFRQSIEIGPDPRPMLTDFWVPYLRGEIEPTRQQEAFMSKTWAEPCDH